MTWVITGIAVASAVYGGVQANNAAKAGAAQQRVAGAAAMSEAQMNAALADMDAREAEQAAAREADQIKRAAALVRGTIATAQSGSGVVIGEGSAQAAFDQLDTLSSADALVALYSGVNRAAKTRLAARMGREAGMNIVTARGMEAANTEAAGRSALYGSLLSAVGAGAKGYVRTSSPSSTGTGIWARGYDDVNATSGGWTGQR